MGGEREKQNPFCCEKSILIENVETFPMSKSTSASNSIQKVNMY